MRVYLPEMLIFLTIIQNFQIYYFFDVLNTKVSKIITKIFFNIKKISDQN